MAKRVPLPNAAQQVGGFFERFVSLQREHHHRLILPGDDERLVVGADLFDDPGQIATGSGVGNAVHVAPSKCRGWCGHCGAVVVKL